MKRPEAVYPATRTFLSIDMDAFYCGVEQKLDPLLRDEPFVVGQKNVAATVSYAGRKLGIKKLQKISEIRSLFPSVRIVNGESLAKYRAAGLDIFRFLGESIAEIERLGLEEFRFEVTDQVAAAAKRLRRLFKSADNDHLELELEPVKFEMFGKTIEEPDFLWQVNCKTFPPGKNSFFSPIPPETYIAAVYAQHLMAKIRIELGFDCSIGVASSKHTAKMATSHNKPHGLFVVLPGYEYEFIQQQSIGSIPGLGHSARQILASEYGLVKTDLVETMHAKITRQEFCRHFDSSLHDLTMGIDQSNISHWHGPAQISKEETFSPYIATNKCLPVLQMLVDSLLAQANLEMVKDGKWVERPLRFRTAVAAHNMRGTGRRSKSILFPSEAEEANQVDFGSLAKRLVRKGYEMIDGLINEPIRVLNVSLVFRDSDS